MDLLYFVLASYGLTQLLCYAKIFDSIRPEHYFFKCAMCMGFWVGALLCVINPFTTLFTYELTVFNVFILGLVSSGTSYVLNMLFGDEGINLKSKGVSNEKEVPTSSTSL